MKIAIIHLSDFHVHAGEHFLDEKIEKFLGTLNTLGNVDEYIIVFSGDLADSGMINEYKSSRYIIGKIISGIKNINKNKMVDLLMVPGNHDLTLNEKSRNTSDIQEDYSNNSIEINLARELVYLNNYYSYSHAKARVPHDKILDRRFCTYNDEYKIQFNLINSSLFSTLTPDDKELHYFPKEKMLLLKKQDTVNLCITVMHHSYEWFNWKYKSDLEKSIINNSELLLTGHDHIDISKEISIDNSRDTWVSCAGSIKFSDMEYKDAFNIILIQTNNNTFCGYKFVWDSSERIYCHQTLVDNKSLQSRTSRLTPLQSYIKELKMDSYNASEDFTKYFVFPKLTCSQKNEFGKHISFSKQDEFIQLIENKKRVLISGSSNSGKSTLLKYFYCSILDSKTPLYLSIDSTTKIKSQKLIKQLFEDQYGDNPFLYEKFQQLDKSNRVIIIDGWDRINDSINKEHLLALLNEKFEYLIMSINSTQQSVEDAVRNEINEKNSFYELSIKPFFTEKRNQLVRNICLQKSTYNDEDIYRVNKLIDSLVHNNNKLFSLNPDFIIRYTDYFIKNDSHDYPKGEAIFSKIFEHGINNLIINSAKKSEVDEIITGFEEIAGYIYKSRDDILSIENFKLAVGKYSEEYNVKISANDLLTIGLQTKLLKQLDDLSIYFTNKNYLAYFIAKYLFRKFQSEGDYSGIEKALRNICFGINSDILLFITYLSNNIKIVMDICDHAGTLLSPWEELSFEKNNIEILKNYKNINIKAPTKDDQRRIKDAKEKKEESQYSEEIIEAKGLFQYNEEDIDKYPFRLVRAVKYTEMLCKALPSFNNVLKRAQKDNLIESIYTYPHKIAYAELEPLQENIENICSDILKLAEESGAKKRSGKPYSKEDILEIINDYARCMVLNIYNHFAELCTSLKTIKLLYDKETIGANQWLEKLMIKENADDTESFIKEAETFLKSTNDNFIKQMIRLVVRKHLLCNPELSHSKKQQIIDKFFGESARKSMLLSSNKFLIEE